MRKQEKVISKIQCLQSEQAANRMLRATASDEPVEIVRPSDLQTYLNTPPEPRPAYIEPIISVSFGPPPPSPKITRDHTFLRSLSFLFPIYKVDEDDNWCIVSPKFYISRVVKTSPDWDVEPTKTRVKSVLFHASHLVCYLSQYFSRPLPFPITIDGPNISISKGSTTKSLLATDKSSKLNVVVAWLCLDISYLTGGPEKEILPNLARIINSWKK